MKSQLITFVIGAACGALGMFLANSGGDEPVVEEKDKPKLSALGSDSDAKKIARLEKRILEFESMGSTGKTDIPADIGERATEADNGDEMKTSGIVKIFGGDGESQIDLSEIQKQMEKSEKQRNAKRIDAKLATLSNRLGLSDEQAEQVRALLEKEAAAKTSGLSSLIGSAIGAATGESGRVEFADILESGAGDQDADSFDFDAELAALLDDDQRAAYGEHVEAQNENYIEATAGGQLAQLQTAIPDLSSEQKDEAFNAYERIAREEVEANGAPAGDAGFDIARMMRQRKAEQYAMQDILTPEQLEVYETNNARMSTISIGDTPGAAVFSSGITVDSIDITPDPPAENDE